MKRFFVTFGQRYAREEHPVLPTAHPDVWLEVQAPHYDAARELVIEALGSRWSNLYEEDDWEPDWYPGGRAALVTTADPELEVIIRATRAAEAVSQATTTGPLRRR